jgi:hypothetical protein
VDDCEFGYIEKLGKKKPWSSPIKHEILNHKKNERPFKCHHIGQQKKYHSFLLVLLESNITSAHLQVQTQFHTI